MRYIHLLRPIGDELGGKQERIKKVIVIVHNSLLNNINRNTAKEGDNAPHRHGPGGGTPIVKLLVFYQKPEDNPINYPPKLDDSVPISFQLLDQLAGV